MKIKIYHSILFLFIFTAVNLFGQDGGPLKVGEEILIKYESPHPYKSGDDDKNEIVWQQEITHKNASYIAIHFSKVALSEGDFILLRSPDNSRSWKYSDSDKKEFWSIPIHGEKAIIEIHSTNKVGSFGYTIDKIARGYTQKEMELETEAAICGEDDSENAVCYINSEPEPYYRSRAVARLLINGVGACTGWLIGSDGHIMTNNHCVGSQNSASNVTVEFMAEGSECDSPCQTWFGCPGTIEATSTTLIQTDGFLDYSLLQLPTNVSDTYGFLQVRETGPILNERIYIPQHPQAWGKRVALYSDSDPDGFPVITTLSAPRCTGAGIGDIGYLADTRQGSSGSPVISYNDNCVVALHHCANCPNRGVSLGEIINDLGDNVPTDAIRTSCEDQLTLSSTYSDEVDYEEANDWIQSTATINDGSYIIYDAGNSICLNPDFNVENGSVFLAHIDGCHYYSPENAPPIQEKNLKHLEEQIIETKGELVAIRNYPNPFSKRTTFEFELQEQNKVRLAIYDVTGKSIAILIDNKAMEKGFHTIDFDAEHIPDGIYFYQLSTEQESITQKMVLKR